MGSRLFRTLVPVALIIPVAAFIYFQFQDNGSRSSVELVREATPPATTTVSATPVADPRTSSESSDDTSVVTAARSTSGTQSGSPTIAEQVRKLDQQVDAATRQRMAAAQQQVIATDQLIVDTDRLLASAGIAVAEPAPNPSAQDPTLIAAKQRLSSFQQTLSRSTDRQ